MHKTIAWIAAALLGCSTCLAAELTPTEMRWLKGAAPVLTFARAAGLAVDVVVQPQPMPGAPPLALAFIAGRCKLVLSMRGNAEAAATLERIAPDLLDPTLELMAAHELGHCQRYLAGAWHGLPAGFVASIPAALAPASRAAYADMRAARREEGYADLVGLAWTQQRHPELYSRLQAWLVAERSNALIPGSHHDTLAWAGLASRGNVFSDPSIFDAAAKLWEIGLLADD